jgi:predicted ArsR family transcriptional regulator
MKPIDYRNATFAQVQKTIDGKREEVLVAWQEHGPCTTEQLAERSGISILTLRPRTTELLQMGFVIHLGGVRHAGIYRAAAAHEAEAFFQTKKREATVGVQSTLFEAGLNVPRHSSDRPSQQRRYA